MSIGAFLQLFIEKNFENTIVCLDDLERKSDKLDIKDILGLVNKLKEEKCKVILIGDIDSLRQQQDIFKEYREKSIETKLHIESITEVAKQIIKEKCPKIQDSIIPYRELIKINNLRIIKKIAYILNIFYKKLELKTDLNNSETENIYKFILLEITKELNPENFKPKDEFNDNPKLREISNIIKKIINDYRKNTFTYIQKEDMENIKEIVHYNTIISKIDKLFNIIKQIKEEKFKDNNIPEINQILENIKEIDEKYKIFINNFKPVDFFALVNYTDHKKTIYFKHKKCLYRRIYTRRTSFLLSNVKKINKHNRRQ